MYPRTCLKVGSAFNGFATTLCTHAVHVHVVSTIRVGLNERLIITLPSIICQRREENPWSTGRALAACCAILIPPGYHNIARHVWRILSVVPPGYVILRYITEMTGGKEISPNCYIPGVTLPLPAGVCQTVSPWRRSMSQECLHTGGQGVHSGTVTGYCHRLYVTTHPDWGFRFPHPYGQTFHAEYRLGQKFHVPGWRERTGCQALGLLSTWMASGRCRGHWNSMAGVRTSISSALLANLYRVHAVSRWVTADNRMGDREKNLSAVLVF